MSLLTQINFSSIRDVIFIISFQSNITRSTAEVSKETLTVPNDWECNLRLSNSGISQTQAPSHGNTTRHHYY